MNIAEFDRRTIHQSLQIRFTALINKVSSNQKWDAQKIKELGEQIKTLMKDCREYGLEDSEITQAYSSLNDIWSYLSRKYNLS